MATRWSATRRGVSAGTVGGRRQSIWPSASPTPQPALTTTHRDTAVPSPVPYRSAPSVHWFFPPPPDADAVAEANNERRPRQMTARPFHSLIYTCNLVALLLVCNNSSRPGEETTLPVQRPQRPVATTCNVLQWTLTAIVVLKRRTRNVWN